MSQQPKVLVIDDEPGVRELISEALSISEITAVQAADGLEALSLLRRDRFDLLILDINMPKLDGLALLEKLRTEGMSVPVLMLSARADKTDINQGLRIGADDYLTKPFSIEELVLRVKAIMRRSKGDVAEVKMLTCGPISMDFSAAIRTKNFINSSQSHTTIT
jgi:two-component system OmpR family response regulator